MDVKSVKDPKAYEEVAHLVRDIYSATNERIAEIEKSVDIRIEEAIDDLVLQSKTWEKAGKIEDSIAEGTHSIFETYKQSISGTGKLIKEKDRAQYKNISEGEWATFGLDPYEDAQNVQTVERLRLQQTASKFQYINYPIARSEIDNLCRYTLGQGVKVACLVPEIMEVIKNFWRENQMESRNKKLFKTYLLSGEYFPLLIDNTGNVDFDKSQDSVLIMRSIASSEIDNIELDKEDRETTLAYERNTPTGKVYYLDVSHPFQDSSEKGLPLTYNKTLSDKLGVAKNPNTDRVMFFKHGLEYDLRGRVMLEPVLRWNRVAVDFLYSRARLNYLRSKIYLVETRGGGTGKRTVSSNATEKMPMGGIKLIETPDRTYRVIAPQTGADDAEVDYRMILYMIGSALSMPLHILNVNAENENYASIKEAANPFNQAIIDLQDELGEYLRSLLRYLIRTAIRRKILKTSYTVDYLPDDVIGEVQSYVYSELDRGVPIQEIVEKTKEKVKSRKKSIVMKTVNIPIAIVFPSLLRSDPTREANAIKIFVELGVMSKYTAMLKVGLNPEVEDSRLSSEFDVTMQQYKDYPELNPLAQKQPALGPKKTTGKVPENASGKLQPNT